MKKKKYRDLNYFERWQVDEKRKNFKMEIISILAETGFLVIFSIILGFLMD